MLPIQSEKELERFESCWDKQASDRFDEFMVGLDDLERPEMLSELIMIDLEMRFREGHDQRQIDEHLTKLYQRHPEVGRDPGLCDKIACHQRELQGTLGKTTFNPQRTQRGAPSPTLSANDASSFTGIQPPCAFGNFQLLKLIGLGGMGAVYEAEQQSPKRVVAVKVLNAEIAHDTEAVARFQRETELIASINSPGVVPVLESGAVSNHRYYTMPLYRGGTLRDRIKNDSLSVRDAVKILLQVTRSLSAVHAVQIVHRDLKPNNILFDKNGFSRIADFGLSRHTDHSRSITRTGQIYGTPGYIAPERIATDSKQIDDFAADLYSLGAILYDMLCGRPPFRGATVWETLAQALADSPVNPASLNPSVDRDLNTICMKCLECQPEDRYEKCADLAKDLENYLSGRPILARPPNIIAKCASFARRHPARTGLIASCVALMMIACVTGILSMKLSLQRQEIEVQHQLRRSETYVANHASAAHLISERSMGWRNRALKHLTRAVKSASPGQDLTSLRSMIATSSVLPDLERVATLAEGMWCDAVTFDPSGRFLAIGQNKDLDGFKVLIYRTDALNATKPTLLWVDCKEENDRRRAIQRFKAEDGARVLRFSHDGTRLAIGTRHGRVHIYRWTGEQAEWLETHDPDPGVEAWRLFFSADDATLWTLSNDHQLRIIRDGKVEPVDGIGENPVGDMVTSPVENAVYLRLLRDNSVLRIDDGRSDPTWTLTRFSGARGLSISHDGRFLAIAFDFNQHLAIVETERGLPRDVLYQGQSDAKDTFFSHAFGAEDDWIVSASDDRIVALWDVARRREVASYIVGERGGRPKIATAKSKPLIAVAEHLKVSVYRIADVEALDTICHSAGRIKDLATDPTGMNLATVTVGRQISNEDRHMNYALWFKNANRPDLQFRSFIHTAYGYPDRSTLAFARSGEELFCIDHRDRPFSIERGDRAGSRARENNGQHHLWVPASDISKTKRQTDLTELVSHRRPDHASDDLDDSRLDLQLKLPALKGHKIVVGDSPYSRAAVYLVYRLVNQSLPVRVHLHSRSIDSHEYLSDLAVRKPGLVVHFAGHLDLNTLRKGLAIDLKLNQPASEFVLEGASIQTLTHRDLLYNSVESDDISHVSNFVLHDSTERIWSVIDEEQLLVSDLHNWNTVKLWKNQSISAQSGRGTLTPLLTTTKWVIAGTTFGEIFVFDAASADLANSALPLGNRVQSMCKTSTPSQIAVGSSDGFIHVLELPSLKQVQAIAVNDRSVDALCFDNKRNWMFAGSEDGTMSVFRKVGDEFSLYFRLDLPIGHIQKLLYLPDRDRLAVLIKNETALRLLHPEGILELFHRMGLPLHD